MTVKLTVLASGRGSNFGAILDAIERGELDARVTALISDQPDAPALARAQAAGIPTLVQSCRKADKPAFAQAVTEQVQQSGSDLIILAGFMRLLSADFVERHAGRILNIHPSLLPSFKGLDAPAQAVEAGVKISGCTVHVVTADMDAGPIIAQAAVPVQEGDTADTLAARILVEEHRLFPAAIETYSRQLLVGA